jgi:hypothetical protein
MMPIESYHVWDANKESLIMIREREREEASQQQTQHIIITRCDDNFQKELGIAFLSFQ